MDQIKIGKFIATLRKECKLTQRQLADMLAISDKTVSKWECGLGLPEVSLMLPLCETLGISVNELLCGKRLEYSEYQKNAEITIMNLMQEQKENKRKLILEVIVIFITLIAATALILVSGLVELPTPWRIALIIVACLVLIGGIAVAAVLEMTAGGFKCVKCGEYFMPTKRAYLMAPHTITRRYLKCPKCGKKSWCVRQFSAKEKSE